MEAQAIPGSEGEGEGEGQENVKQVPIPEMVNTTEVIKQTNYPWLVLTKPIQVIKQLKDHDGVGLLTYIHWISHTLDMLSDENVQGLLAGPLIPKFHLSKHKHCGMLRKEKP